MLVSGAALVGLLIGPCLTGAAAATPSADIVTARSNKTVKAGSRVRFFLGVDHVARCSAHLGGSVRQLNNAMRFDRIEVFADIPLRSKPGRYAITVGCSGATSIRLHVTVREAIPVTGTLSSIGRHLRILGSHYRALTPEEAVVKAHERWLREEGTILSEYRTGQCTDWAAQKRPDVVERINEAIFVSELLGTPSPSRLGNAENWPAAAAAVGYLISDTPAPGALVVWQGGVEGADLETGHIGYVESVAADASSFSESSMNVGGVYMMDDRTLSSTPVAGRSFIWP